jgi:transcriptional regulator with XRE-family HTH domain
MNDSTPELTAMIDQTESQFSAVDDSSNAVTLSKVNLKETENPDDGVSRVLSNYEIGQKLRQLRLRKKIALVDLGKHTGLSASMLSQLENGKLVPTLPTLARIAMVFDVGLEHFFNDRKNKRLFSIVRSTERLRFPDQPDSAIPGYYFEVLSFGATDKSMSAYLADFPKRDTRPPRHHSHDGAEFLHVLSGNLTINYQSEDYTLNTGDSVYFDASEPHSYCCRSEEGAHAIVVTMLPRL